MKLGRFVAPALLAAVMLVPGPAFATAKIYDMAPLLNQPDPFQQEVPPAYRPARHAPARLSAPAPPIVSAPAAPVAPAPPRMPPPAPAATPVSIPAEMPAHAAPRAMPAHTAPVAPTPLMIPIGREPTSDSSIRPVGRLPTGITPQR